MSSACWEQSEAWMCRELTRYSSRRRRKTLLGLCHRREGVQVIMTSGQVISLLRLAKLLKTLGVLEDLVVSTERVMLTEFGKPEFYVISSVIVRRKV